MCSCPFSCWLLQGLSGTGKTHQFPWSILKLTMVDWQNYFGPYRNAFLAYSFLTLESGCKNTKN